MYANIKTMVRGAYDLQKLRIQMGNRIVGTFKVKLGQEPSTSEEELDEDGKEVLAKLRLSFKKITDGVVQKHEDDARLPPMKKFKGDGVIDTYTELCLVAEYMELESTEKKHFRRLENVLQEVPIYKSFLSNVRGVGPAIAGVLVSEFDITKCKYSSSMWMYAGLDVANDGQGRSRKAQHLVDREYIDKEGNPAIRKSITFNPFLKTKLIGVLGSSFLRAGIKEEELVAGAARPEGYIPPYAKVYYDYKNRLENNPVHQEKTKGHRHSMAIRYMIKIFLIDLYREWRTVENLPVYDPYHEAKLGLKHKAA